MTRIEKMLLGLMVKRAVKYRRQLMDTKKWYASKTVWGGVVAFVATVLQVTGVVNVSGAEQAALIDQIAAVISVVAQLVGTALAIYGRVTAKSAISNN